MTIPPRRKRQGFHPGCLLRVIVAELARQAAPTPPQQSITLQLDQRPPNTHEPSCSKPTARLMTSETGRWKPTPHTTPTAPRSSPASTRSSLA
uniref:Uncharacterized protein n=1 Tax=Oryza meridionalis TaxID=40149 RepID=A0A0E0EJX5_9ORYZ